MQHYCLLYSNLHLILIEARWLEAGCTLSSTGEAVIVMVAPYSGRC